ncbi:MAG: putative signal transducing protein [Deltaproteobacteria bacterium]
MKGEGNSRGDRAFIEVYKTQDLAIAGLIKEVFEDHGIICHLQNYALSHLYPTLFSNIKIMVYRESEEDARAILFAFFSEEQNG